MFSSAIARDGCLVRFRVRVRVRVRARLKVRIKVGDRATAWVRAWVRARARGRVGVGVRVSSPVHAAVQPQPGSGQRHTRLRLPTGELSMGGRVRRALQLGHERGRLVVERGRHGARVHTAAAAAAAAAAATAAASASAPASITTVALATTDTKSIGLAITTATAAVTIVAAAARSLLGHGGPVAFGQGVLTPRVRGWYRALVQYHVHLLA